MSRVLSGGRGGSCLNRSGFAVITIPTFTHVRTYELDELSTSALWGNREL